MALLGKMAANLKRYNVNLEERFPSREALPVHEGRSYATEVVVQLYYPAGASPAGAEAREEDHAAAVA